jgi:hypothetical protein
LAPQNSGFVGGQLKHEIFRESFKILGRLKWIPLPSKLIEEPSGFDAMQENQQ